MAATALKWWIAANAAIAAWLVARGGQPDANAHPWRRSGGWECYRPRPG